jgi:hypothetical protein
MDFQINSFLLRPGEKITDLKDPKLGEKFIAIEDVAAVKNILPDIDSDYIDGYLFLKYQDSTLLSAAQWDLIDDLWAYILNLIEEMLERRYAECYFPDQPLLMSLTDQKNFVIFALYGGKKKWLLPRQEFLNALLDAAEHFFKQMKVYFPQNQYNVELKQIEQLRLRL